MPEWVNRLFGLWLEHPVWVTFGLVAEAIFMGRFIAQWIASERAGKSVVPVIFWYMSVLGSTMLVVYAVWRRDPVFILGQALPCIIYFRNLVLIKRERQANGQPPVTGAVG
jgi:lipid-A-disaccharide synthase-like uncharacterized protein